MKQSHPNRRNASHAQSGQNHAAGLNPDTRARIDELRRQIRGLPAENQTSLSTALDDLQRSLEVQPPTPSGETEARASSDPRLLDAVPTQMGLFDLQGQCTYANPSWLAFTGRSIKQELGSGWLDGIDPEDRDRVAQAYREAIQARLPFQIEYRLRSTTGKTRWVMDAGRPLPGGTGEAAGYISSRFDLSSRREMEDALTDSVALFKALYENAPDAVIAIDQGGKIVLVNQQAEILFGYTRQELLDQPLDILMPPNYRDRHAGHVHDFMENPRARPMGEHQDLFAQRKDGSRFPADITLGPVQLKERMVVLAAIRDKTDQKQAEEILREREQMLHTAISAAPISFLRIDREGIVRFWIGRGPSRLSQDVEPVGQSVFDLYQDYPDLMENCRRTLRGESYSGTQEINGRVYYINLTPLFNGNQSVTGVTGVSLDITGYKQIAEALRKSEQRFRQIFNQADLGIFLMSLDGQVIEANPLFHTMLGYSQRALRQVNFFDLIHSEDRPSVRRLLEDLTQGRRASFHVESRCLHRDGSLVWGRLAVSAMDEDGTQRYAIGMIDDISEQKRMRAELSEVHRRLVQSSEKERLHLSQELHDGPIQELQGVVYQIAAYQRLVEQREDGQHKDMLHKDMEYKDMWEARDTLQEVIRSLRAISGELRPPALAPFGLEKAIRSYIDQVRSQHSGLEVEAFLMPDGQLLSEQVRLALYRIFQHSLTNVVKHSRARHVFVRFTYDAEKVILEVQDDGIGFEIPERWVEYVREGHFGIVGSIERAEAIGGRIKIESQPGKGTTIRVVVPKDSGPESVSHKDASELIADY